jgi:hypothetical protein
VNSTASGQNWGEAKATLFSKLFDNLLRGASQELFGGEPFLFFFLKLCEPIQHINKKNIRMRFKILPVEIAGGF